MSLHNNIKMKPKSFICPSCKQRFEHNELSKFIDHAMEYHGRLYSSKPRGENYDILMK